MIAYAAVYMGIGVLCVCLARRRLRRNIF
jgi:hypothetical protein